MFLLILQTQSNVKIIIFNNSRRFLQFVISEPCTLLAYATDRTYQQKSHEKVLLLKLLGLLCEKVSNTLQNRKTPSFVVAKKTRISTFDASEKNLNVPRNFFSQVRQSSHFAEFCKDGANSLHCIQFPKYLIQLLVYYIKSMAGYSQDEVHASFIRASPNTLN